MDYLHGDDPSNGDDPFNGDAPPEWFYEFEPEPEAPTRKFDDIGPKPLRPREYWAY